ncbi:PRC-barrel domain-containing protein [Aliidiomarina indica]|uniref:PRC-barrel domain-containing protein n=1 Tax=Aliidiomarina indica TaxID=2749147 RepID=UPI00188E0C56|nr:PRC-barrel domain-containing protein [Aliidiomarina indica]
MNYETRDTMGIYKANGVGPGPGPHQMGANTLVGNDVCNHKEESLGDIKEIMLDVTNGKVTYAVLSFGSFLGMGEKLFAVPWSALTLDTENKRFILNVEKDSLSDAPGFDKKDWPNMADATWSNDVDAYYASERLDSAPR